MPFRAFAMVTVDHEQAVRDQETHTAIALCYAEGILEIRECFWIIGLRPVSSFRVIWYFGLPSVFIFMFPTAEKSVLP